MPNKAGADQAGRLRGGAAAHAPAHGAGAILFADRDRHVTAEALARRSRGGGRAVSLATVYNTLHQFTEAGLLRQVVVDGARTYFDTNTGDHHHFYREEDGMLIDIESDGHHR